MTQRQESVVAPVDATGLVQGTPGNYYGCVSVWQAFGTYWMGVENWDGLYGDEISKALYDAFVAEFGGAA
jgi:hypothetical protein